MEANQWAQFEGVKGMEEIGHPCTSSRPISSSERKVRPQKDQVVNCPRCQSTNTKFCYYNNYSLTQPRYFCKTCRRYWTEGGTLRNVPVGGGSRKNRRSSSSSTSSSTSTLKTPDSINNNPSHISQFSSTQNPNKYHQEGHDLNLANFPYGQDQHHHYHFPPQIQLFEFPNYNESNNITTMKPPNSSSSTTPFAALELLRNGFSTCNNSHNTIEGGQSSSSNGVMYNNVGFPFQDLKPSAGGLNFSVVDHNNRFGSGANRTFIGTNGVQIMHDDHDQDQDNINEKVMFPLEASLLKQKSIGDHGDGGPRSDHHNKLGQQLSNGCSTWNGMLGGGSW